jgi:hypothetical protein
VLKTGIAFSPDDTQIDHGLGTDVGNEALLVRRQTSDQALVRASRAQPLAGTSLQLNGIHSSARTFPATSSADSLRRIGTPVMTFIPLTGASGPQHASSGWGVAPLVLVRHLFGNST